MSDAANGAELRQIVEQIESAQSEKDDAQARMKELYDHAGSQGYDKKVLRQVLARRRKDRDALSEEEHLLMMYEEALQ